MSLIKTTKQEDLSHFIPDVKEQDFALYEKFINKYNPTRDLKFTELPFRKGASVTGIFGLENGFKKDEKGNMVWGYIRDHTGVDRARGGSRTIEGKEILDVVEVPFDFNRSSIVDFGNTSYGTLTSLFNDEFQFEFRIAHLNPDQIKRKANEKGPIIKWSLDRLKRKLSFEKGWVLGSAGSWGDSTGAHTHTEIKSLDESCEVFDILLFELYKEEGLKEYTNDDVILAYKKQSQYATATNDKVLRDYAELKKGRKIIFTNKYKTQYVDSNNEVKTRYATNLLFNGL